MCNQNSLSCQNWAARQLPSYWEFHFQFSLSSQIGQILTSLCEGDGFLQNCWKKLIYLSKWLVRPWSSRPVLSSSDFWKAPWDTNETLTGVRSRLRCRVNKKSLLSLLYKVNEHWETLFFAEVNKIAYVINNNYPLKWRWLVVRFTGLRSF